MAGKKSKVLLINPNQTKPIVTPLGLEYLGSALVKKGWETILLDLALTANPEEAIADCLADCSPLAVGITVRNIDDSVYPSGDFLLSQIKEIIQKIKNHTSAPLILGGCGFSIMPEEILKYLGVDYGICGEGEETLPLLLECLQENRSPDHLAGLVWKTPAGIRRNSVHFVNPKKIPSANRRLIDNRRYLSEGGQVGIEAKRGCDRNCIYCADPVSKGRRIRCRPPSTVVAEMENLLEQGINYFHFCDSEFNLPLEHAEEVCRAICQRGIAKHIHWYAYCIPSPFTKSAGALMKKAGCRGIDFGVDTVSEEMLKNLGRDFGLKEIAVAAEVCHHFEITFMFDLLLGGPGETRDTLKETMERVKEISPDRIGVNLGVRIYPGTPLAEYVREEDKRYLVGEIDENENFLFPVFYLSPDKEDTVEYLCELIGADERFYFAPLGERRDYNYNDNRLLVVAISKGARGAFWDILRQVKTSFLEPAGRSKKTV